MSNFLLVTVHDPLEKRDLTALFNSAEDWVSYAPGCWIVKTSEEPRVWAQRLRDATDATSTILVTEMGRPVASLPRSIWDWLQKNGKNWRAGFEPES
jgi:hypothetical protein